MLILATASAVTYAVWSRPGRTRTQVPTFSVRRGPLVISVDESGTVQSRQKKVVTSKVKGRAAILSLIEEGTNVKQGDLLIVLDSSPLEDRKSRQQIVVQNGESAFIHARENLAVVESQAASDIDKAKLEDKFAQMDLEKYLKG